MQNSKQSFPPPTPRALAGELRRALREYPAAALLGARQCGKTTLARTLGGHYFDLESEADRLRLNLEWDAAIAGRRLLVLDEAQAHPAIFPRLRTAIDEDRHRYGRFLLLGSIAPALMHEVSESLAGRIALLELTPFLIGELPPTAARRLWLTGGFPDGGVLRPSRFGRWQQDYLNLLAQRDLPGWGFPARPQTTLRLMRLLAAVHGDIWNASQIASTLGLSYHTINGYVDFLCGAFLLRMLPPFTSNARKRMVKRPKMFWRDSGLLHATLNVTNRDDLLAHPQAGASWEGHVIEQITASLTAAGKSFDTFFWRTSNGREIDLVLDFGSEIWAIEIKLSSTPDYHDMETLNSCADIIKAKRRFLVSQTKHIVQSSDAVSCNLPWLTNKIAAGEI